MTIVFPNEEIEIPEGFELDEDDTEEWNSHPVGQRVQLWWVLGAWPKGQEMNNENEIASECFGVFPPDGRQDFVKQYLIGKHVCEDGFLEKYDLKREDVDFGIWMWGFDWYDENGERIAPFDPETAMADYYRETQENLASE